MNEKTQKFIEKLKAVASSSPVVTVAIALLELALAELKRRREPRHREITGDQQRHAPMAEVPWEDE